MIILEGADCSGKTTLCEMLTRLSYGQGGIAHQGVYGDHATVVDQTRALLAGMEDAMYGICDRLHLGEFAYGPVYRQGSRITPQQSARLEDDMRRQYGGDTAVIFCIPPWDIVRAEFVGRRDTEMFGDQRLELMERVHIAFDLMSRQRITTFRSYVYDWTEENAFSNLLEFLIGEDIR